VRPVASLDTPLPSAPARNAERAEGRKVNLGPAYFLLRRCTRVRLSSLRCFFLAMRLRRFLMTEPTTTLAHDWNHSVRGVRAHTTYVGQDYPANRNGCNPGPDIASPGVAGPDRDLRP